MVFSANYHVKAAITNGATEKEIRATLAHLIPYCGFPAAFDAFEIAEKALLEESSETASQANDGQHKSQLVRLSDLGSRNEGKAF